MEQQATRYKESLEDDTKPNRWRSTGTEEGKEEMSGIVCFDENTGKTKINNTDDTVQTGKSQGAISGRMKTRSQTRTGYENEKQKNDDDK